MFQAAVNLHLVPHTLDHTSFVHCFFVNLQMGTTELIIHQYDQHGMGYSLTAWCFGLILVISLSSNMGMKH